jgi:hypothetical protein
MAVFAAFRRSGREVLSMVNEHKKTRRAAGPLDKLVKRYMTREKNLSVRRAALVSSYTAEIEKIDAELKDIREIVDRLAPAALKAVPSKERG